MSRTIQRADIAARLVKALHLKERTPAPTLHPEIFGVIIVDDLREQPQQIDDRPCSGAAINSTPTAGNLATVQLFNPAASNMLLLVDSIIIGVNAISNGIIYLSTAALTTLVVGVAGFKDSAQNPLAQVAGQIRTDNTAAPFPTDQASAHLVYHLAANSSIWIPIDPPFVVNPGHGVCVGQNLVTSTLSAAFQWREKPIQLK